MPAVEIAEHRHRAGHCFEGGVGHALIHGGDDEQIERVVEWRGISVEACQMDSIPMRTGGGEFADALFFAASASDEKEMNPWMLWCKFLKRCEKNIVFFKRAKTTDNPKHCRIRRQSERGARSDTVTRREVFGVHAVNDCREFFTRKAELNQLIKLALRDGVNCAASPIEFVALAETSRSKLPRREAAVFAMQNGIGATTERSNGSVNERAEIVCVDDVWPQTPKCSHECPHGTQAEAAALAESMDIRRHEQPVRECAAPFQTGDVCFKSKSGKAVGKVAHAIFHPAWIERRDDMEDARAHV